MPELDDCFIVARNPNLESTLPYLLRVPVDGGVLLKARERWPTTSRVYCHPLEEWPVDAEIVEAVGVRSCRRQGAAIDLVLDRARNNRSQIVLGSSQDTAKRCISAAESISAARAGPHG